MKHLFTLLLVSITLAAISAQNLAPIGHLEYDSTRLSDIWGYETASGHEYALVGVYDGFSIVDVSTDPTNPVEKYFIPGPESIWRDIKVWGDYAYVVNDFDGDQSFGMLIVDLTNVEDSINHYYWTGGPSLGLEYAHNVFMDENGKLYIVGSNIGVGGALVLDCTVDPYNPTLIGEYTDNYIHDCFVRGDTLYSAEVYAGHFAVVDMSDPMNPAILATQTTSSFFTHNIWLSDDGTHVFTTDEVTGGFIDAYDITDLSNIQQVDKIQTSPGTSVIPHNTFVLGDFLVTSYYADGVLIHNASNPSVLVETGRYDTSPFDGTGFNGCWGVYPYASSGLIYATDIQTGFYLLQPTFIAPAYLSGNVVDSVSGAPLGQVQVEVLGLTSNFMTDGLGDYNGGTIDTGVYDVLFSKAGYYDKTISGVILSTGQTYNLDVELVEKPNFTMSIEVMLFGQSTPIANALASIENEDFSYQVQTDGNGMVSINNFYSGDYEIVVGKWGYVSEGSTETIDPANTNFTYNLAEGYYDDFALDFNWSSIGTIFLGGEWERGEPIGFNDPAGNGFFAPDLDIQTDLSDKCYVTGNGGSQNFPVITPVTLLSPTIDLSTHGDPYLSYSAWFANGYDLENDSMVIEIYNGTNYVVLDRYDASSNWEWVQKEFRLLDYTTLTNSMRLQVRVYTDADINAQTADITEAAFDGFMVVDSGEVADTNHVELIDDELQFEVYPNPVNDYLHIDYVTKAGTNPTMKLEDLSGRVVINQSYVKLLDVGDLAEGIYLLSISDGNNRTTKRVNIF